MPAMLLAAALPLSAQAQQYPNQDIHFICAFPPGSGADVLVRYFAEKVRPLTGKNVIVENKSGAGGNIAMEYVGQAKAGRLHGLHPCRQRRSRPNMWLFKKPPFPDAGKAIQVAGDHQPAAVHAGGRRQVALQDDGRIDRGDEEEGRQGDLRVGGADRHGDGRTLQGRDRREGGRGELQERASTRSTISSAAPSTTACTTRSIRWRSSARAACAFSASAPASASMPTPDLPTMTEQGVPMDLTGWWAAMVPQGTPEGGRRRRSTNGSSRSSAPRKPRRFSTSSAAIR